jgi:hypothetical protein
MKKRRQGGEEGKILGKLRTEGFQKESGKGQP